jgi:hypothetical protein
MKSCSVEGCREKCNYKLFCNKHYRRFKRNGHTDLDPTRRERGTGSIKNGYVVYAKKGREHVLIAEKAIGRKLPKGAIVHHVDGNPLNNAHTNLVVCPNQEYHMLLHVRSRAMTDCGNPDWRKCVRCLRHDDPTLMILHEDKRYTHRSCKQLYERERYQKRIAA